MSDDISLLPLRDASREQPHLLDYVRVLLRRKFLVVTVFLAVILGAMGYLATAPPVYEAAARLIIETTGPSPVNGTPADESDAQQSYFQTHYQLLQSRRVVRKTITDLGLWDHPQLNPSRNSGVPLESLENAVRWTRAQFNAYITPAPAVASSSVPASAAPPVDAKSVEGSRAQDRIVSEFLSRLTVMPVQNSRLVDVTFRSADPELAVRVVNGLSAAYISDSLDSRVSASRETTDWLNEQIEKRRRQVADAEAALQNFRERNDALAAENGQNIVMQKLADLNAAVTKAKTERLQREAVYQQVASVADQPQALDAIPSVLGSVFVQQQRTELAALQRQEAQLTERLGDLHPEIVKVRLAIGNVQRRLRSAVGDIVQSLRRDYESALAQENSLVVALNQQKLEAQAMNRTALQASALDREVESSKSEYDSLMERARQAAVVGELRTSNVRIVDMAAEPEVPISPKRVPILLIALIGGVFLSVSAAFFAEYLDHRVKTPEQIETHLRLASLGAIPRLSRKGRKALTASRTNPGLVPSNFAEAFRGLRTNVLFSSPDDSRCSIVVTSASPREGKTIVASNLAIGLAQAGHRVILLDADLRRPGVHGIFGVALEPGLSNLLVGDALADDVLQPTAIANLRIIGAGSHSPNPAELVASSRFDEILSSLEAQCDVVVIDTPPVMAVADASILAHRTSGVLFVVAADTTNRHAAQAALEQLIRARGRFLGAVLNRVDPSLGKYAYAPYTSAEYSKSSAGTSQ